MVVCRPADGDIALLPGHVPFLGALGDDPVRILLVGGGEQAFAVHGGFVEMSNDRGPCSPTSPRPEQIDVPRAQEAKARAEEALGRDAEDVVAQAELARADTRIHVATDL